MCGFWKINYVLDCDWDYTDFSIWGKCSYMCGYETNQEKGSPIDIVHANAKPENFKLSTPDGENLESEDYRDVCTIFDMKTLSIISLQFLNIST